MKKRILSISVALLVMLSPLSIFATNISIDGHHVNFTESSGRPFIDNANRTQVPLRVTMESYGCEVDWDNDARTAIVKKDGVTVQAPVGQKYILKDGKRIENDTSAIIKDGRTYLPIRAVLEAFGANVGWDGNTKTVIVSSQKDKGHKVTRVVDGDTIIVDLGGKEERVRLIGVDTPESVHPDADRNIEYGKIASAFTKNKLEGKNVTLEYDAQERDHYGRILAYVYIGGKMFNKTLLEEGHAKVATYPPNVKYVDDFTAIQKQAQANKVGVWAYESFNGGQGNTVTKPEAAYIGNSGTLKYHRMDCRYAGQISDSNIIYFKTKQDAKGYEPCKVCNP